MSSRSTIFTKVLRASLCGLPVARALSRARLTVRGLSVTRCVSTRSTWGCAGTFCRSRTALAMTSAMSRVDFSRAVRGSRSGTAVTPGKSSASEDMTTPVSPSAGRTRSMYQRNDDDGPTMSTPALRSRSRCS